MTTPPLEDITSTANDTNAKITVDAVDAVKEPIISKLTVEDLLKYSYIMEYRKGLLLGHKYFIYRGDFKAAINRAQRHCDIMGYKMAFVRPLFSDLLAEEQYRVNNG